MTSEKVIKLVAEQFGVEAANIGRDTSFIDVLNADSLDIVELTMVVEEEFGMPEVAEEEMQGISTVGDLIDLVERIVGE